MTNLRPTNKSACSILLLLCLILLVLPGCQTMSLFQFESLVAPKIIIPPDVKTIGFVDRNISFDTDTLSNYYNMNNLTMIDSVNYDDVRSLNCHLGLSENLSEYYALDSVPFVHLPEKHLEGDRNYEPIKWETVDSICEATGSDILICLEDLQIYNTYKTIQGEEYWGITDIQYYVAWRIYDPLPQKYLDERILLDSLFTEVSSYSYSRLIEDKLPSRKEINIEVSYEIGKHYAGLISPTWQSFTRKYFITGHQDFTLAQYYLNHGQLDQAMLLWEKHAESDDFKIAGRAAYNLALGYELKENFQQANHWMRKSIANYRKIEKEPAEFNKVKKYFKELTKRTQNSYLLDQFFGKEKTKNKK